MIAYISYFTRVISIFLILFYFEYSVSSEAGNSENFFVKSHSNELSVQGLSLTQDQLFSLIVLTREEAIKKEVETIEEVNPINEITNFITFPPKIFTQKEINSLIKKLDTLDRYKNDKANARLYSLDEINFLTQRTVLEATSKKFHNKLAEALGVVKGIKERLYLQELDNKKFQIILSSDPEYIMYYNRLRKDIDQFQKISNTKLDTLLFLLRRIQNKNPKTAKQIKKQEFDYFFGEFREISISLHEYQHEKTAVAEAFFDFAKEHHARLLLFLSNLDKDRLVNQLTLEDKRYNDPKEKLDSQFRNKDIIISLEAIDELEKCRRTFNN